MKFKSAESLYQVTHTQSHPASLCSYPSPLASFILLIVYLLSRFLFYLSSLPPLPLVLHPFFILALFFYPPSPILLHLLNFLYPHTLFYPPSYFSGPTTLRCGVPRSLSHPRSRRTQLSSPARTIPYLHPLLCFLSCLSCLY